MKQSHDVDEGEDTVAAEPGKTDMLLPLLLLQSAHAANPTRPMVVVGELIAMKDDGQTPLVTYPGQTGSAAIPARSIVDLRGSHIGKHVVLLFESNEHADPIVMGVLREGNGWPAEAQPSNVEVQADGERMVVSAKRQLVLRCGKASITLTEEGKILVKGTYLSSRSSGVHRIKGGAVQIN
jgi:uncharacterized protein DUF6484